MRKYNVQTLKKILLFRQPPQNLPFFISEFSQINDALRIHVHDQTALVPAMKAKSGKQLPKHLFFFLNFDLVLLKSSRPQRILKKARENLLIPVRS